MTVFNEIRYQCVVLLAALLVFGAAGCDKNKKKTKTAADEGSTGETGASGTGTGDDTTWGGGTDTGGDASDTGSILDDGAGEDVSVPDAPPPEVDDKAKKIGEQHLSDALMAAGSGNKTKAKASFEKSLNADPSSYQAAYNLGAMAEAEGDEAAAKKYYKQAISSNPQYGPAIKAYSYLFARTGSLDSALGFAKEKHEKYPQNPDIATAYAELLVMSGKGSKAIEIATLALKEDETNVPAMMALARAYLASDQHEFAGFILDMAEKVDPADPVIYYLRAIIFEKTDYPFAAMDMHKKAIELKPDFVEAMSRLSVMQINGGSFADAAQNLEKVLALVPDSAEAHLNMGEAYRGMKEWEKAHEHLTKAEKLGADKVAVTLDLAFLYFAAPSLPGMDRIEILKNARTRFLQFRDLVGPKAASQTVDVDFTLKQIDKMITVQEKLAAKKKKAAEEEAAGGGEGDDGGEGGEVGEEGTGEGE